MSEKVPVSILIPVRNEAANLPRCLESIQWAGEVIVVDSHSTDGSVEICADFGAKVVQFDFNGTWPKKKNWALENVPFQYPWVFILDADEELALDAEAEIRRIVSELNPPTVGYWINRRFFFMGKWLKHAYQPNWNLRLFLHKLGRFEKLTAVDTASGDNEIHEHVIVNEPVGHLRTVMNHYAFPDVAVFIEKHNRYSNWEARVAVDQQGQGDPNAVQHDSVGRKRRLKALAQNLPFRPTLRFLYVYFIQRGFLDGSEGYYFARLHATYELLCVIKTAELRETALTSSQGTSKL